jgi:aryl-alcohol dehydrogenase-like predicted oxidoreductase
MRTPKFILGTANLGSRYGISNVNHYDRDLSRRVINHALIRDIDTFDTAAEYGFAEELIGELAHLNPETKTITKIPVQENYTYEYVINCLESSLDKLKQEKIYGLMFHDPDIGKKKEIPEISKKLLDTGKLEHLGFSAYKVEALLDAKEMNPNWTIFQVPENILDRRLKNSLEMIDMAKSSNVIFVRSIFLQGLLLIESTNLPGKFQKYEKIFREFQLFAENMGVNTLDLCLSYASEISWSSGNIVAAASISQLDEILDFNFVDIEFDKLESLPEKVLDPRRWDEIK